MIKKYIKASIYILILILFVIIQFQLWLNNEENITLKTNLSMALAQITLLELKHDDEIQKMRKTLRDDQSKQDTKIAVLQKVGKTPARIDPKKLSTVYILPYPPHNRGRFLKYESYVRKNDPTGRELIIFNEFNNDSVIRTAVPSTEVRWDIKEK